MYKCGPDRVYRDVLQRYLIVTFIDAHASLTVMDRSTKDRLDEFDQYVMNHIPIRLIRLSDMTLVSREDVREHFRARFLQSYHPPSKTVKYATLSHRWGKGEPSYDTFEEMKKSELKTPGFEKLMNFCEKAREYDVEFAWSDTCCIDKSSSAELDESIRSMFQWYRKSEICIAHLAQSKTMDDIPRDEWTERGWTLQELLAPIRIKFFNQHWIPMARNPNDKHPDTERSGCIMLSTLESATGIPRRDICDFAPAAFWVNERMQWAARRKTTRVEDMAYSLMGIFNVSLQIAYGEGERAFGRLIEAVMQDGDPSVLNWTGQAANYHNSRAVPRSPQCFVGGRGLDLGSGRLDMTMTSLGLRVPLVILPLDRRSTRDNDNKMHVTLECSLCPAIKIDSASANEIFSGPGTPYAIGIVNYSVISDGTREFLMIRGKSAGFLLFKPSPERASEASRPVNCVGLQFVPSPEQVVFSWKALNGGLAEVHFPNILSDDIFYISHDHHHLGDCMLVASTLLA
ncbi:heterokaryon incompatibility protein-domain-containing protein [Suillus paluster]|uniref:heterokaryon incompatibility protein-domain-containing protein n=1 Tax=Suillus paluster TaxID=48578 RepID=UPI001B85E0AD|nr:heterokaryon incompatibility protein-domain-containing protein [Suillus paluster]KAG1743560.1 heterokaryon incompatibility protein-domain-containing protein [Suillus paluster]